MLSHLWALMLAYRWKVAALIALSAAIAVLNGVGIGLVGTLIDLDTARGDAELLLMRAMHRAFVALGVEVTVPSVLAMALAVTLATALLTVANSYLSVVMTVQQEQKDRMRLVSLLTGVSASRAQSLNHGNVQQVVQVETGYAASLTDLCARTLFAASNALVFVGLMLLVSAKLSFIVFVGIGLLSLTTRRTYLVAKLLGRRMGERSDEMVSRTGQFLRGYREYRVFDRIGIFREQFARALARYSQDKVRLRFYEAISGSFIHPAIIGIIWVSYFLVHYTAQELVIFVAAMVRLNASLKECQNTLYKISYHAASLQRVDELRDQLELLRDTPHVGRSPCRFDLPLELRAVTFAYPGQQAPALAGVSLEIAPGSFVGLAGQSGGGKSTLTGILLGLHRPVQGRVLLGGVSLEELDMAEYLSRVGYVSQDVFIFDGTLRENILFFRDIARDDLERAVSIACIDDFARGLPLGLDSPVGEFGVALSGGQRQRVALARALAGRPRLLILDEATSALDNATEAVVKTAIEELAGDVTVICVAHRLSSIRSAHKIFVLEGGRVVESGSYDILAHSHGPFAALVAAGEGATADLR